MSLYEKEVQRQIARTDIPAGHNPLYRWFVELQAPQLAEKPIAPDTDLSFVRVQNPSVAFYRFLYDTAGEAYLWGDRRRMDDEELAAKISPDTIHLMVLWVHGEPGGFYELDFSDAAKTNVNYFALLPGFEGRGLGRYLLQSVIYHAGQERPVPLTLDTCSLDHPVALENYLARGFKITSGRDEIQLDPRVEGLIAMDAAPHIPLAR